MLTKSFEINTSDLQPFEPGTRSLLLELSPTAVSVILWNKETSAPEAFEVFGGQFNNASDWEHITSQSRLLGLTDLHTEIIHAYDSMLPLPADLYTPEQAAGHLATFFGHATGMYQSADILEEASMALAWQLPADIYQAIAGHFKVFRIRHVGSCLLNGHTESAGAKGKVLVYGSQCWISLWNQQGLLIMKSVAVSQPDDLSWHLLNICKQFGLPPNELSWELAGMAQESSPLWNAVTRYFEPVQAMASPVALPVEMPGHYFAHLYQSML